MLSPTSNTAVLPSVPASQIDVPTPSVQTPVYQELDNLADQVTAVVGLMDILMSQTAPVRSGCPQVATDVERGTAGGSPVGQAILKQANRLAEVAEACRYLLNTLEV